jgi:phosphomannomutase
MWDNNVEMVEKTIVKWLNINYDKDKKTPGSYVCSHMVLEKPLEGLHIVVDAGNGAGGFFVDKVLKPLGAITTGSQFLEPDGNICTFSSCR